MGGIVRQITLIRIEVVINGRKRKVVAANRDDINALLSNTTSLGDCLRDMVDDVLDAGDTIDDGRVETAPAYETAGGGEE